MRQRKKQNWILGAVAGLGIILILGVLWVFSLGFRFLDYHDKEDGFFMKYPDQWTFDNSAEGASVIFFAPLENELDNFKENVNVVVQDISKNPMTLNQYTGLAIRQMEAVFGNNLVTLESEPTRFAGQKGYRFVFLGKGSDLELKYLISWTIKDMKAYQVTYTAIAAHYDKHLSKVKKMFRSFRIE